MTRSQRLQLGAIAFAFSLLAASSMAGAQSISPNSGIINFSGEIVADPYLISERAPASESAFSHRATSGELVFEQVGVDRASACVQVQARQQAALDIAFVGIDGKPRAVAEGTAHCIGQDGGTLSMASNAGAGHHSALVTVAYD